MSASCISTFSFKIYLISVWLSRLIMSHQGTIKAGGTIILGVRNSSISLAKSSPFTIFSFKSSKESNQSFSLKASSEYMICLKLSLIKSAILILFKLKLIEILSDLVSTACQIPAGWYKKSPSFSVISKQSSSISFSSNLNGAKF